MESIGPFRLDSEPGHGAMGVAIRSFDSAVAIKIIQRNQFATANEKGFRICVCRWEAAPHQTPSG